MMQQAITLGHDRGSLANEIKQNDVVYWNKNGLELSFSTCWVTQHMTQQF
jgi:hypothetical protein